MSTMPTGAEQAPSRNLARIQPIREPMSLMAFIKRALRRFVRWLDSVDVDGQAYWSR